MDPPAEVSLDQILATVPPQNRPLLDQKISDISLANIARSLTNWSSVCSNLGITEPEEEAIVEENRTADGRRRAVLRKWRQKYSPSATYRNLAKCFYSAGKPDMVEAVCKALGAPSDSVVGQSASLQGYQPAAPPPGMQQVTGQFGNPVGSYPVPHQQPGGVGSYPAPHQPPGGVGSYPAPHQPPGGVAFGNQPMFSQPQPPQQGVSGMQPQLIGPVYNLPQSQPMYTQQQLPQQPSYVQMHMPGQAQQVQQPQTPWQAQQMQHQILPAYGAYGAPQQNYGVSQPNMQQFYSQPATMMHPQPMQPATGSGYPQQPTVSHFFPSQDKQTVIPDGGPDKEPFDRYEAYSPGKLAEIKLSFDTVIPDTTIKQSADGGVGRYEMRAAPHGIAIIINNEEFDSLSPREGTDIDEKNLIQTFRYLGYTVEVHREKTSEQILGIFEDIRKRDHSKHDSFVCCILTHGKGKGIFGCDGKLVEIEAISSKLNGKACQTLVDKPKMFFIQACRGKARDTTVTDSDESEGDPFFNSIVTDSGERVPMESDFFFGYATPLNYVAFRDMDRGSWYIIELCRILCTYGASASLTDIHKRVKGEVNRRYQHKGKKQISEDRSRLRKAVFFI